jgi:hypothetical protein
MSLSNYPFSSCQIPTTLPFPNNSLISAILKVTLPLTLISSSLQPHDSHFEFNRSSFS